MTQKEFIEILDEKRYSYEIEGDKIIVTHKWNILLSALTSLPHGVVFKNSGSVNLESLTYLPPGVEFRNGGDVYLRSLIRIKYNEAFGKWLGNIKGIDSKMLLNVMIKQGLFER